MSLVRRRQWEFITQHDEDRACQKLKELADPTGAKLNRRRLRERCDTADAA